MPIQNKGKIAIAAGGGALALALSFIGLLEGFGPEVSPGVYRSYLDIAHVVTICNGHTGPDVHLGQTATEAQCAEFDEEDLGIAFSALDRYIDRPEELAPNVRAAGALFTLNVGSEGLRTSSFRRLLNQRRIPEACNSLMLWVKARVGGGPPRAVQGLINRRTFERKLCLGEKTP